MNKRAARLRLAVQAPAIGNRRNKAKLKAHGNGRPPLNRLAIRPRRESCRAAKRAQNTTACTLTDMRSTSSGLHSPYLRHLPETKEKRPPRSDIWADGETILMGESPYSDRRQDTARHEMCRGAIACTLTDARSASSGVHSPYLRHLPETKEKRPEQSDLWADGETLLMGESPYSDCR